VILALRIAPLVFVAATLQVGMLSGTHVLGAEPDVLLVTVVALALVAGSLPGAAAGFVAGLLVDVMTLGTLGTTSIVLVLAGYWAGRYGETTGRGRAYAPPLAAFAITILAGIGGVALHFLLGQPVSARAALVSAVPSAIVAAVLALGVYRICRAFLAAESSFFGQTRRVDVV
jgi:rod shape-determining protein MreD